MYFLCDIYQIKYKFYFDNDDIIRYQQCYITEKTFYTLLINNLFI